MKGLKLTAALGGALAAAMVAIAAAPAGAQTTCQSQAWPCNNPALAAPVGGLATVQASPVAIPYSYRPTLSNGNVWVGHALGAPVAYRQAMPVAVMPNHGRPTLGTYDLTGSVSGSTLEAKTFFGAPVQQPVVLAPHHGQPALGIKVPDTDGDALLGAPVAYRQAMPVVVMPNHGRPTLGVQMPGYAGVPLQPTPVVVMPRHGQPTLGAINTTDPVTHNKLVIHTGFGAPVISPPPVIVTVNGRPTLGATGAGARAPVQQTPVVFIPHRGQPTLGYADCVKKTNGDIIGCIGT